MSTHISFMISAHSCKTKLFDHLLTFDLLTLKVLCAFSFYKFIQHKSIYRYLFKNVFNFYRTHKRTQVQIMSPNLHPNTTTLFTEETL